MRTICLNRRTLPLVITSYHDQNGMYFTICSPVFRVSSVDARTTYMNDTSSTVDAARSLVKRESVRCAMSTQADDTMRTATNIAVSRAVHWLCFIMVWYISVLSPRSANQSLKNRSLVYTLSRTSSRSALKRLAMITSHISLNSFSSSMRGLP